MTNLLERLQAGLPNRYRIERQLGEGGMAVVLAGTDLTHDRQVAIKVLRPELSAMVGADHADRPRLLIEGSFVSTLAWNHDIAPDDRLLVLLTSPEKQARTLGVITGFPRTVERLAGARSMGRWGFDVATNWPGCVGDDHQPAPG